MYLQDSARDLLNALNLLNSLKKYILHLRNSSVPVNENKVIEIGPEIKSLP